MMVEWSETWRQNPSRTLPRKCTASAEATKAHTTRNCGAKRRITMADHPKGLDRVVLAGLRDSAQGWLLPSGTGSEPVNQPGLDQEGVEAARLRAVLAGIEHAATAQHD